MNPTNIKKSLKRFFKYLFIFFSLAWAVSFSLFFFIQRNSNETFLLNISGLQLSLFKSFYILSVLALIWFCKLLKWAWLRVKHLFSKVLLAISTVIVIVFMFFNSLVWLVEPSYYEFVSPEGKYSLVVSESALFTTSIKIYERKNFFFINIINSDIYLDDCFSPMAEQNYNVSWNQASVDLALKVNNKDEWASATIPFDHNDIQMLEFKYFNLEGNLAPEKAKSYVYPTYGSNMKLTPQAKLEQALKSLSKDEIVEVPNSNLAIIPVDYAMAATQWFLCQTDGKKYNYTSELPSTYPIVIPKLNARGTVFLEFKDIYSNSIYFKEDGPSFQHWVKITKAEMPQN